MKTKALLTVRPVTTLHGSLRSSSHLLVRAARCCRGTGAHSTSAQRSGGSSRTQSRGAACGSTRSPGDIGTVTSGGYSAFAGIRRAFGRLCFFILFFGGGVFFF